MKSQEIYYQHSYYKKWETRIQEIVPMDRGYAISLEETAFYPGGGGQPSDRGNINHHPVMDVFKRGDQIFHLVEELPQEREVTCQLDATRRFDLMQQHSGQHLLSAVFYNLWEGETSSFHLGKDSVSIDISIPNITHQMIDEVEKVVNEYIYKNLRVLDYRVDQSQLKDIPLRKHPSVQENIRIVEIEGVDYSPCGGTHVASTGEIGIIKIVKKENYKGITRIYFKCGYRAIKDYQRKGQILTQLSSILSVSQEEVVTRIQKELEEGKLQTKEIKKWRERAAYWEGKHIISKATSRVIKNIYKDKHFQEIEDISKNILDQGSFIILFASGIDGKILLYHGGESTLHCGKIFREYLSQYGGRGGGSAKKAQGAFSTIEDMEGFYKLLEEKVGEIE